MEAVDYLKKIRNQMSLSSFVNEFLPKNGDRLSVILLDRIGAIGLRGFSGRFGP
jgi:hypothetical protein